MVEDVLAALAACAGVDAILLVSAEPAARALAAAVGAEAIDDPLQGGQSAAALLGLRALPPATRRALLVPGDCPALDPAELQDLLRGAQPGLTVVPDRHGTGTNALLIEPPDAVAPSFGPGSGARHLEHAAAAGVPARTRRMASLEHDVDTPADLQALTRLLDARPGAAPRTRAALPTQPASSGRRP